MEETTFEEAVEIALGKDPRYQRGAYQFVREALDHTQKEKGKIEHVTGQELLEGIRDCALKQFGPMAMTVLEEWGVGACEDFGEIVFNLIEVGWFGKTDKDSRADFAGGYEFYSAFRRPFLPPSKQKVSISRKEANPAAAKSQ
jgi:uncharacterized repeat protein (TIGR04138 family)